MTFRMMAMMSPEGGAGGGGGGAGGAASSGGAGGGAAGAGAGAGAGGGKVGGPGAAGAGAAAKGGAGAGAGAGGGDAAAAGMTAEEFEEWEDGGRRFRTSKTALRHAFQREGALNNKMRELTQKEKLIAAADEEREEFEARRERGDIGYLLGDKFKGDRVAVLARAFKEAVDHENKIADPTQRALLEKASEVDQLRRENTTFKKAEAQKLVDAEVTKRLQQMSARYMPALEKLGLPKNDLTLQLMRGEDRVNQRLGLNLSPEALAESTRGALVSLVDEGLTNEMTPGQAVIAFPKLARLIHKGLIEAEMGRRNGTVAKTVPNPKKAGNGGAAQRSEGETGKGPRVMNHAEIQKETGIFGL